MRVVYIINSFAAGGAELVTSRLAPRMRDYGFVPVVVALGGERDSVGRAARTMLEAEGVPTEVLDKPAGRRRFYTLTACVELIRRWDARIVHTVCSSPDFFGGLSSTLGRARHVSTLATVVRPTSAGRLAAWRLHDWAARTHYIAISEAVSRLLAGPSRPAPRADHCRVQWGAAPISKSF